LTWLLRCFVLCFVKRLLASSLSGLLPEPPSAFARLRERQQDRLTLDGRPFSRWRERMHVASSSPIPRAVRPSGGRSRPLLCLHALS